jgi:hypothetical protein
MWKLSLASGTNRVFRGCGKKKREVELFWLAVYFFLRIKMAAMMAMRITIVATMM